MKSILTDNDEFTFEQVKIEADVIVTAVVLGFAGTRWHQNQPFSFDYEHPNVEDFRKWQAADSNPQAEDDDDEIKFLKEIQEFMNVMSAMTFVIEKTEPKIGPFLREGQSAAGYAGALITGRAGGQGLGSTERHKNIASERARRYRKWVVEDPELAGTRVYEGRGAYTGLMDDPVNDRILVQSTKRVIDQNIYRWHPGEIGNEDYMPWGLIRDLRPVNKGGDRDINLREDRDKGLGPLPKGKEELDDDERIGYIHGMSSAIVQSIANGPWCTPYEIATGDLTTKMASCFACTTYMYAAGFPPSSIHLGRGESWVPPSDDLISGETTDLYPYNDRVVKSVLTRWHTEIHHYLMLGAAYLKNAINSQKAEQQALDEAGIELDVIDYVNPTHHQAIDDLEAKLKDVILFESKGGNLFLDALTVHQSDWKRIWNTLKPVFEHYEGQAQKAYNEVSPREQLEKRLATGSILVG